MRERRSKLGVLRVRSKVSKFQRIKVSSKTIKNNELKAKSRGRTSVPIGKVPPRSRTPRFDLGSEKRQKPVKSRLSLEKSSILDRKELHYYISLSKIYFMQFFSQGKKVLVADDEKDTCLYLKKYLERKKLKVTSAFDGEAARKFIETDSFDYLLLDCSMPGLTGLELIATARQHNPSAKIILLSAFPSINDDVVRKLGGDLFVQKPVQMSAIDEIFKEAVSHE